MKEIIVSNFYPTEEQLLDEKHAQAIKHHYEFVTISSKFDR